MDNEHIIHIIKKLRIFILSTPQSTAKSRQFAATIYDEGRLTQTIFGETYNKALTNAAYWVLVNFEIPKSLETISTFEDGLAIGMEVGNNELA